MNRATAGLLLVSVIWGTTFVAVKSAMDWSSPILFVGIRFSLAALLATPLLLTGGRTARAGGRARAQRTDGGPGQASRGRLGKALRYGLPLGVVLVGAYATQTIGLTVTSPARSAFVTGLNVALVPFWGLLITGQRPGWLPVVGLIMTLPGLWLLTSPEAGAWNRGDSWTLVCAVLYALYVVLIGRWGKTGDLAGLLVAQLAVTAVLALIGSPILETPRLVLQPALVLALILTAFLATTGTTWLQLKLQPKVSATRAAVIYATEPVFAGFFAWVLLGETLPLRGWAGGALILAGMLVSEIGTGRGVPERS